MGLLVEFFQKPSENTSSLTPLRVTWNPSRTHPEKDDSEKQTSKPGCSWFPVNMCSLSALHESLQESSQVLCRWDWRKDACVQNINFQRQEEMICVHQTQASFLFGFSNREDDSIRSLNAPIKIELPVRFRIADIPQEAGRSTPLPKTIFKRTDTRNIPSLGMQVTILSRNWLAKWLLICPDELFHQYLYYHSWTVSNLCVFFESCLLFLSPNCLHS